LHRNAHEAEWQLVGKLAQECGFECAAGCGVAPTAAAMARAAASSVSGPLSPRKQQMTGLRAASASACASM